MKWTVLSDNRRCDDSLETEHGLSILFETKKHRILLFTGCAHSGLENILSACPWPVHTVVGGFHLLDGLQTEEELAALAQRLKTKYPETLFYTSHCTGDKVFATLKTIMDEHLHAFSCGTTITV